MPTLEQGLDPVAENLRRQIKELFDPHHLLHPGEVLAAPAVLE